jgi:sn-glycerol 3-phosphate transport system substrate-binding protein
MTPKILALALLMHAPAALAVTELQFWHSMSGAAGEQVSSLANQFNASQPAYRVVPVYKGSDEESLAAAIGALQAGNAPHILHIFDAGTGSIAATRHAIKPLYRLMAETREKFDAGAWLPAVSSYYADRHGKMLSLPFNSSTAVFFYNKEAFSKAGLDPNQAPRTWPEVQAAALKLQDSGAAACAYTTDWQSWILVESLSAWHNEPFATRRNGFDGADAKLSFNAQLLVRHIGLMSSWMKSGLFIYAGRTNGGEAKFASGECAMVTSSSAAYARIAKTARFAFAEAPLPYYDEFKGAPYNTIVRGASLWVPAGKKPVEYKGVAKFFSYFSRPEVQSEWSRQTGYLPNTLAAYALSRKQGYYEDRPGADAQMKQLSRRTAAYARGLRLGDYTQIRALIDEELEAVWHQTKTPKEALDTAVERGNAVLRRFERAGKR